MAEVVLYPAKLDTDNSEYYEISEPYPATAIAGKSTSNSGYGVGINILRTSGAITKAYFDFDVSSIPNNVTITSVTCTVAIYGSSTFQSRTSSRSVQLCKGTTGVGTAENFSVSGSTAKPSITNSGSWTRSDLNNLKLLVSTITNQSVNANTYMYIRGADLTISYTEGGTGGGGGSGTPQTPATFTITENLGTYQGNTNYISDGSTSTGIWRADNKASEGKYVQWTFDKKVHLTGFSYTTTNSSEIFDKYTYLQYSTDGNNWTDIGAFSGNATVNFSADVDCQYVRMYCKNGASGYVSITEAMPTWTEISIPGSGGGTSEEGESEVYSYTGAVQTITLNPGKYKLECWGAQGGTYNNYAGGLGGYSVGIITLTQTTTCYLYVGGQPAQNTTSRAVTSGGFNGGGNGQNRYYSSTYTYGQGGGGGTDIRIGQDSLYARVIVAGGGGGSASNTADNNNIKYGGGESGGPGGASSNASYVAGQTAPSTSNYYRAGTFGQGAAAYTNRNNYQCGSGGGGGGWYGGYAYNYAQDSQTALQTYNGGGSGYVYTSSSANNYPSGCLLNQTYYLEEAQTIGGNSSFPSSSGGNETGHQGNGAIRITQIIEKTSTNLFFKINGAWKKVLKVFIKNNGEWQQIEAAELNQASNYLLK